MMPRKFRNRLRCLYYTSIHPYSHTYSMQRAFSTRERERERERERKREREKFIDNQIDD